MHLLVFNLTGSSFACRSKHDLPLTVQPNTFIDVSKATHTFALTHWTTGIESTLSLTEKEDGDGPVAQEAVLGRQFGLSLRRRIGPSAHAQRLETPADCPWMIYRSKVCHPVPIHSNI